MSEVSEWLDSDVGQHWLNSTHNRIVWQHGAFAEIKPQTECPCQRYGVPRRCSSVTGWRYRADPVEPIGSGWEPAVHVIGYNLDGAIHGPGVVDNLLDHYEVTFMPEPGPHP